MSDIKVSPPAEADPAATSIQNDKTVEQTSNPDQTTELSAAPTTSEDAAKAEEKTAEQNDKKEEKSNEQDVKMDEGMRRIQSLMMFIAQ
jgi:sorbitol-specific phosphotransferase system component IIBC